MFITFFLLFIVFIYFILITCFVWGWNKLPEEKMGEGACDLFISVIIPFRDECENLPFLLDRIARQTHTRFELILVNDHSSDYSLQAVESFRNTISNMQLLHAVGFGKKNALKEGIAQAKGALIVCTDADCVPTQNWLQAIAQYQSKEACDMLICPVRMLHGETFFSKLQALEFASLIASGAGAAAVGMPIMCNGANMAFTPNAWNESIADLNEDEASGDDMFLLMSVKKRRGKIRFVKSKDAVVETTPCATFSEFFNQRKRWASKSKSYTDWQVLGVGLLVLLLCVVIVGCGIGGFSNFHWWKVMILTWFIKTVADSWLLIKTADFFDTKSVLKYIPILSFIYPFYVFFSAVGGLLGVFSWKGR
ncbi:MAG: glycosyltransferase [Paludibacteraceae bacterium]|nr:glycosyltransferase [Paludibacteraceae bacterium]